MIRAKRGGRHAAILAAVLLLLAGCGGEPEASRSGLPVGTLVIETTGGPVEVEVEIAETREARVQGLRNRESLAPDAGMVFLPDRPTPQIFTMADTLIPLSLAVWGEDGRILAILDMEPCKTANCPLYDPGVVSLGAVEVNQGFFAEHGVAVGDPITLQR